MTTTASPTGQAIVDCLKLCTGYGEMLTKDIPADQFAHMPHPTMNHPAFCIGHLAIYPNRVLEFVGHADRIVPKDGYEDLFKAGVDCVDDPGRYPGKDELMAYYVDRHTVVAEILPDVPAEVFTQPNPVEGRFSEMVPTIGAAVNFLMTAHHMVHLGQLSSWRRAMNLPSVM